MRIVLLSTFWLDFQGSQALQKACQMDSKWSPKLTKSKKTENLGIKKTCKNKMPRSRQKYQNDIKMGSRGGASRSPEIIENHEIFRNSSKWLPWVSRARKGIPKASKRQRKGSQKGSRKLENDVQKASSRHSNSISN